MLSTELQGLLQSFLKQRRAITPASLSRCSQPATITVPICAHPWGLSVSLPAKPSSSRAAVAIAACRVDPAAAAVELTDVSFAYDLRPILTGITMTIPRGKIVAIMGASGSGKTTILRLIG